MTEGNIELKSFLRKNLYEKLTVTRIKVSVMISVYPDTLNSDKRKNI